MAIFLHYLFLSSFCWMLCEGIMLYLLLVVVFSKLSKNIWFFLAIGYGECSGVACGVWPSLWGVASNITMSFLQLFLLFLSLCPWVFVMMIMESLMKMAT